MSYNRELNFKVGKEVVVHPREVRAAARYEGERGLDLEGDDVLAVNNLEDVFTLLVDLVAQRVVVLDDIGSASDGCCGGDVV